MAEDTFSLANKGLKLDSATDLEAHIGPLKTSTTIKRLDLSGNTFGVSACEALAPLLAAQKELEYVALHDIFTSRLLEEIPPALSAILTALLECPKLHTVNLSDNAFGLKTKDPLVDFLSKHTPLQHLILNNNGMGPIAGALIADALTLLADRKTEARVAGKNVPDLESIVCGRNRLENGSMAAWARAYQAHSTGIKSVKMTQNGIRQEGISHLLREGLRFCSNLEVLDMQDNTFTIKGATALSQVIGKWRGLKELGVGDDLLGARGSIKVFEQFSQGQNKEVEILRLQYNDINPKGLEALVQALKNGSLPQCRRIELNGNKFDEEDPSIEILAELLSERKGTFGHVDDADDMWGLDELDELEGEDEDEEEEDGEESEEEEEEVEEEDKREKILKEADEAEDEKVTQKKDKDVDELADVLGKQL